MADSNHLTALPLTLYGALFIALSVGVAQPDYRPYLILAGVAFVLLAYGMLQSRMLALENLFHLKGIATILTMSGLALFGLKLVFEYGLGMMIPVLELLPMVWMFPLGGLLLACAACEFKGKR